MPRRRMISPDFWKDPDIRNLTRDERLLFIGCFSNADDEGRLLAHPAHLKASIFMYDSDIGLDEINQLRDSMLSKVKNITLYENSGEEYLAFRKWQKHQKPSHPRPSDLPAPPEFTEPLQPEEGKPQESFTEPLAPNARTAPESLAPSQGQSSQGEVRLDKVRGVQEDFTEFLDNESDLNDFLTMTLTKYMSSGRQRASLAEGVTPEKKGAVAAQWGMPVIEKFWTQAVGGKLSGVLWHGAYNALQKYPVDIIAKAFVKAGRYQGGKHKSWKYIQTIIDEQMEKHGRSPPHS